MPFWEVKREKTTRGMSLKSNMPRVVSRLVGCYGYGTVPVQAMGTLIVGWARGLQ